jgi:hypothetical protein
LATRSRTSFKKRQKELARQEKQRDKAARRIQRKLNPLPMDSDSPESEFPELDLPDSESPDTESPDSESQDPKSPDAEKQAETSADLKPSEPSPRE